MWLFDIYILQILRPLYSFRLISVGSMQVKAFFHLPNKFRTYICSFRATIFNKLVQRDKAKEEIEIIPLFVGGKTMFLRICLMFGLPILLLASFSEARSPPWYSAGRNPNDSGKKPSGSEREKDSGTRPSSSGDFRSKYNGSCVLQKYKSLFTQ